MEIRLLRDDYKKDEQLFHAFVNGTLASSEEFFSGETIEIDEAPDFPFYMGKGSDAQKKVNFLTAFQVIAKSYIHLERDIHFDERFWHSLLVTEKREYILKHYPQALENYKEFCKIVIKDFDWENYIYKCILAVEYIEDSIELNYEKEKYYELIVDNLDVYNYIIKYSIFRNGQFLVKILTVISELEISNIMKSKIKDRPDLGQDERYGRRVIFELNKSYPVLMSPLLDIETLKQECIRALSNYYDISAINNKEILSV